MTIGLKRGAEFYLSTLLMTVQAARSLFIVPSLFSGAKIFHLEAVGCFNQKGTSKRHRGEFGQLYLLSSGPFRAYLSSEDTPC